MVKYFLISRYFYLFSKTNGLWFERICICWCISVGVWFWFTNISPTIHLVVNHTFEQTIKERWPNRSWRCFGEVIQIVRHVQLWSYNDNISINLYQNSSIIDSQVIKLVHLQRPKNIIFTSMLGLLIKKILQKIKRSYWRSSRLIAEYWTYPSLMVLCDEYEIAVVNFSLSSGTSE